MQLDMFSAPFPFPHTFEELEALYCQFLKKENEDADAFTWNQLQASNGRSYSFYGVKVFEFYPGDKAKFRILGRVVNRWDASGETKKEMSLYTFSEMEMDSARFLAFMEALREEKATIFRNTITERFACCQDFVGCSDAKQCLHADDRFFNGCEYRKNLEAGRIFYGKNMNIE